MHNLYEKCKKLLRSNLNKRQCKPSSKYRKLNKKKKFTGRTSSLNLQIEEILKELKVSYVAEYQLNGFYYDFYLSEYNLIWEIHGSYWHFDPSVYGDNPKHKIRGGKYASEVKKRDSLKESIVRKKGYGFFVTWESEVKKGKEHVISLLEEQLRKL